MNRREYGLLFVLGLSFALGIAAFQPSPGYMDAEYYYATGEQLASGQGFVEPFLWNYLDDPAGLPHPSHLYWMPLAALLAASGMWLEGVLTGGAQSFFGARAGSLLLAACLPPVTAAFSREFGANRRQSWMAGLLALFPGFYLPFLTTTDTFGIYMLLGVLFLQTSKSLFSIASSGIPKGATVLTGSGFVGALAGLMHLARADGVTWVLVGLAATWWSTRQRPGSEGDGGPAGFARRLGPLGAVITGYLLVVSPWIVRNMRLGGSLTAPGAARALWITRYDELFAYPASLLTPEHWLASGIDEIVRARLWAMGQNLQSALAVQGEVFLAPLILVGLWRFRRDPRVRLAALAWMLTFLAMTLVFPFQGARGGWFHSGAALQPLFWAVAPVGLQTLVEWGVRRRGWAREQAGSVLGMGVLGLAVLVTTLTAYPRLIAADRAQSPWSQPGAMYTHLEIALQEAGAPPGASVLVNNPPGYFGATGRPALVIPDGDETAVLAVARRYQGAYLLLEANHPKTLEALYRHPGDRPGLDYLFTVEGTHIFHLQSE